MACGAEIFLPLEQSPPLIAPALNRFISTQLFGVGNLDPITLCTSAVVMVALALLACWIPARRAAAVDPIQAIRAD